MAPSTRFELTTFRLGGGRSILLSYEGLCCRRTECLAGIKDWGSRRGMLSGSLIMGRWLHMGGGVAILAYMRMRVKEMAANFVGRNFCPAGLQGPAGHRIWFGTR